MFPPPLLQTGPLPSTLIIGLLLTGVGVVLLVRPELSVAPLGGDAGPMKQAAGTWGRFVGAVNLLLGGLLTVIGVWNYLYA